MQCRVGKEGHHDLVLADANMCSDLTIVKHELVLQGATDPRPFHTSSITVRATISVCEVGAKGA